MNQHKRTFARVGATLALALGLTACGSSSGSGSTGSAGGGTASDAAAATPAACILLTQQIATDVLGTRAKKTREYTPNPHMTQCTYTGPKAFANVEAGDCSFLKQFDAPVNGTTVRGVGDYASAAASGMLACKRDLGLSVDVGIVGSYSGDAAADVEKRQLALEKKLANEIFAAQ